MLESMFLGNQGPCVKGRETLCVVSCVQAQQSLGLAGWLAGLS